MHDNISRCIGWHSQSGGECGGQVGLETAEFLAEKSEVVEMLERAGQDIEPTALGRIAKRGIKILTKAKVEEIRGNSAIITIGDERQILEADTA